MKTMHEIMDVFEGASRTETSQKFYNFVKEAISNGAGQYLNEFDNHANGTHHTFAWCVEQTNGEYDRDGAKTALSELSEAAKNQGWKVIVNDTQPGGEQFVFVQEDRVSGHKTPIATMTYFEEKVPLPCSGWAFDIVV